MRNATRFTKIVLAAALGGMALSACGTTDATTGRAQEKVSAATAPAKQKPTATPPARMIPPEALEKHPDPEVRSLALETRIANTCAPGSMPALPALPAVDDLSVGPDPYATESPEPVPLPTDLPEPPLSEQARPEPAVEAPLSPLGTCVGNAHAERIRKAFDGDAPAGYAELRERLTALHYLPEGIHRMPDQGGRPRVRLDLRPTGVVENLAVDVTTTAAGVTADPFGLPDTPITDVTQVKRGPNGS
ncbi:hypothetical protein PV371_29335 [Streptomyces sp. TX20-6-3]|uniref:hypothetical protein n=1 Tax=Streptomyces sp. TX20-6-3 TaxID=3028705 RepID=UPI0029A1C1F9|nr:hypothetical protein [Streptomyces sp. TX20-6-3]MDX2563728.1 hypothetical protein [Streptomyces sp. TX20-6-3]